MKNKIIIIGAGGHGRVVADAVLQGREFTLAGFVDDKLAPGSGLMGYTVLASSKEKEKIKAQATHFIVGIGDNAVRKKMFEFFSAFLEPAVIIHPTAVVSSYASVGRGSVVLPQAVISAGGVVGENCIMNSLSLLDHDSVLGNHVHISQGTVIGSNCRIADMFTSAIGQHIVSNSRLD